MFGLDGGREAAPAAFLSAFGLWASLLAVSTVILGCGDSGDGRDRQTVSGSVTLDGQPVAQGTIQFLPASEKEGMSASGVIENGKYSIDSVEGPVPGEYRVVISSAGAPAGGAPAEAQAAPGESPPLAPELIPAKYNAESTLTATISGGKPNMVDFALSKK